MKDQEARDDIRSLERQINFRLFADYCPKCKRRTAHEQSRSILHSDYRTCLNCGIEFAQTNYKQWIEVQPPVDEMLLRHHKEIVALWEKVTEMEKETKDEAQ